MRAKITNFFSKTLRDDQLAIAFNHFDFDNSGYISVQDLQEIFKQQGKKMTFDEVNKLLFDVKTAKPGQLNFQEFKKLVSKVLHDD